MSWKKSYFIPNIALATKSNLGLENVAFQLYLSSYRVVKFQSSKYFVSSSFLLHCLDKFIVGNLCCVWCHFTGSLEPILISSIYIKRDVWLPETVKEVMDLLASTICLSQFSSIVFTCVNAAVCFFEIDQWFTKSTKLTNCLLVIIDLIRVGVWIKSLRGLIKESNETLLKNSIRLLLSANLSILLIWRVLQFFSCLTFTLAFFYPL